MNGIQYITDKQGNHVAVQIDLNQHGELWEDVYDRWLTAKQAGEPCESVAAARAKLLQDIEMADESIAQGKGNTYNHGDELAAHIIARGETRFNQES